MVLKGAVGGFDSRALPSLRPPSARRRTCGGPVSLPLLALLGLDLRKVLASVRGAPRYFRDLREFRRQRGRARAAGFPLGNLYPCLTDWAAASGVAKGHYFHQDLLVARRVHELAPRDHVDVGSRVDGFVAHVASFRPITVVDVRPLRSEVPNIRFVQADLMAPLAEALVDSCDSLSCLHALEHFGLGRYGDPVRVDGDALGLENLRRMLRRGGRLYLSVPIGPERVEFNAHRVYSVSGLLDRLAASFRLERFSYVDDGGDLHEDVPLTGEDARRSFGVSFGCGIFELVKR
jgi:SAM-dependent methyltransferase